ncbi:MAG: HAMP domain-containing protein, partial [Kineosporiaceae bacterium]
MILDRLLVRQRITALAAIPVILAVALLIPVVGDRVSQARTHSRAATVARTAQQISGLVEQIQRARLLAVGYLDAGLVPASTVLLQYQKVADAQAGILALDLTPHLRSATRGVDDVLVAADAVTNRQTGDFAVLGRYDTVIGQLIDALGLENEAAASPGDGAALLSLDALLRADEAASSSGALLLAAATNPGQRSTLDEVIAGRAVEKQHVARFARLATPAAHDLFARATTGASATRIAEATIAVSSAPETGASTVLAREVLSAVQVQTTLRQLVEGSLTRNLATSATLSARQSLIGALAVLAIAVLLVGVVVWLATAIGRSVALPLRRLTEAATSVADLTRQELTRVADEDAGPEAVPALPEIEVRTRDEIGDLAVAFNRVRITSGELLERQLVSRRNVAAMFAGIGRRTSNLVGRQLSLIDRLEREEEDPGPLRTLYQLDHMATRLRRNASSLIVLSGAAEPQGEEGPLPLPDAIRAALGTVEEFRRVRLGDVQDPLLAPSAVSDTVLLLAELIENATQFSPPHAPVEVTAQVEADGRCTVTVTDEGIGMPPERLAEENERLRRRERLDLAPTDVLGLFVVGRIARRHEITVTLTPGGARGLVARVSLPATLFVSPAPVTPAAPVPRVPADIVGGRIGTGTGSGYPGSGSGPSRVNRIPLALPHPERPVPPQAPAAPGGPTPSGSPVLPGSPGVPGAPGGPGTPERVASSDHPVASSAPPGVHTSLSSPTGRFAPGAGRPLTRRLRPGNPRPPAPPDPVQPDPV